MGERDSRCTVPQPVSVCSLVAAPHSRRPGWKRCGTKRDECSMSTGIAKVCEACGKQGSKLAIRQAQRLDEGKVCWQCTYQQPAQP